MCTAFSFVRNTLYFGRNMDIEYDFGQKVVVTPRNFALKTKKCGTALLRFAMIGMANVTDGYPLYAEAANEKGLCMAGLNFPSNAVYVKENQLAKKGITPFEFIPYILGLCESVDDAKKELRQIQIADIPFSSSMPLAPLHWIICDRQKSIVVESTSAGLDFYDSAEGVITNNPTFAFHEQNIRQYMHLSAKNPVGTGDKRAFCQGAGAVGLPGDFSSPSRFVKTVFCKENSHCDNDTEACVSQVFHILDSVAMVKGSVITEQGADDVTTYSCCIDTANGDYYYKTYGNNRLTKVRMTNERMTANGLSVFELRKQQDVFEE